MPQSALYCWKVSWRVLLFLLVVVSCSHALVIGYGSYLVLGFVPGRPDQNLLYARDLLPLYSNHSTQYQSLCPNVVVVVAYDDMYQCFLLRRMPYLRRYTGLQLQWVLLTSLIAFSWSWRCDLLLSSQSRSLLLLACRIPLQVIAIQETEIVQTR